MTDGQCRITPARAHALVASMGAVHERGRMREVLPADHVLARRLELMTLAVLGQLEASANWHRIAREWLFGDPPATQLGREERTFWQRGRGGHRAARAASRPGGETGTSWTGPRSARREADEMHANVEPLHTRGP